MHRGPFAVTGGPHGHRFWSTSAVRDHPCTSPHPARFKAELELCTLPGQESLAAPISKLFCSLSLLAQRSRAGVVIAQTHGWRPRQSTPSRCEHRFTSYSRSNLHKHFSVALIGQAQVFLSEISSP